MTHAKLSAMPNMLILEYVLKLCMERMANFMNFMLILVLNDYMVLPKNPQSI